MSVRLQNRESAKTEKRKWWLVSVSMVEIQSFGAEARWSALLEEKQSPEASPNPPYTHPPRPIQAKALGHLR